MKCKILPCTPGSLQEYQQWMAEAGAAPLQSADGWIFIASVGADTMLASGAALFVRPDHVLLAAHYFNLDLCDSEAKLEAVARITVGSAMSFSTAVGRQLRSEAHTRAYADLLAAYDFREAGPALPGLMFVEPGIGPFEVAVAQKQEPAPTAREPLGPVGKETAKPNRKVRRAAAAAKRRS